MASVVRLDDDWAIGETRWNGWADEAMSDEGEVGVDESVTELVVSDASHGSFTMLSTYAAISST